MKTLEAFERAVTWAAGGSYSAQDIDEAKLGVFQKVSRSWEVETFT